MDVYYGHTEVLVIAWITTGLCLATFVVVLWGVNKARASRVLRYWLFILAVAASANTVLSARRTINYLTDADYRAWLAGEYRAHVQRIPQSERQNRGQ